MRFTKAFYLDFTIEAFDEENMHILLTCIGINYKSICSNKVHQTVDCVSWLDFACFSMGLVTHFMFYFLWFCGFMFVQVAQSEGTKCQLVSDGGPLFVENVSNLSWNEKSLNYSLELNHRLRLAWQTKSISFCSFWSSTFSRMILKFWLEKLFWVKTLVRSVDINLSK